MFFSINIRKNQINLHLWHCAIILQDSLIVNKEPKAIYLKKTNFSGVYKTLQYNAENQCRFICSWMLKMVSHDSKDVYKKAPEISYWWCLEYIANTNI